MSSCSLVHLNGGLAVRIQPSAGERILWLHGYTMDSSIWAQLWELLPEWYHIGVDLPGHGLSRAWAPNEDLSSLADCLYELALEFGVRHLVSLSFGTLVSLQMVIQRPQAFASVVLAAPALVGGPQDVEAEVRYKELIHLYFHRGPGPHLAELWMKSPPNIFKGAAARPELWQQLAEVIGRHSWAELRSQAMLNLTRQPQSENDLRRVSARTLVLVGDDEIPAFRDTAEIITRSIMSSQIAVVPGAGHLCLLEEPNASSALIRRHLSTMAE